MKQPMNHATVTLSAALTALTLSSALLLAATSASAMDIGATHYRDAVALGGRQLQLNGAGVRHQGSASVYAAGLYLEQKAATPEQAMAQAGLKQLDVVMLRDIDAAEMGAMLARSTQDNVSEDDLAALVPVYFQLGQILGAQKSLKAGDRFQVQWIPAVGTVITINGKPQGQPLAEPAVFNVMLRMWLGSNPADAQLKQALLGQAV